MVSPVRAARTAQLRSAAYGLLAAVFRQPGPEECREWGGVSHELLVRRLRREFPEAKLGIYLKPLLLAAKSISLSGRTAELAAEYNQLFSPTPSVRVPLWASAYGPGYDKVMGAPARSALQAYRQAGLEISPEVCECPDHLVVELEFMAELCAWESAAWGQRNADVAACWAGLQRTFLTGQVGPWVIRDFLPRLAEHAADAFYAGAGTALAALITTELAAAGERGLANQSGQAKEARSVALPPAVPHEVRAFARDCTLCGLCTLHCQPGAITLELRDRRATLLFTAETCTGCGRCQQACPEKALTVSRKSFREAVESGPVVLVAAEIATCSRCGATLAPQPMLVRTRERMGRLSTLCPGCQIGLGLPGL